MPKTETPTPNTQANTWPFGDVTKRPVIVLIPAPQAPGRRNVAPKGQEPVFETVPTENQRANMRLAGLFHGQDALPEVVEHIQPAILPHEATVFVAHEATQQEVRDDKYVTVRFLHVSKPIEVSQYVNKGARTYDSRVNVQAFHEALQAAVHSDRYGKCFSVIGSGDVLPKKDAKTPAEIDYANQVLRLLSS